MFIVWHYVCFCQVQRKINTTTTTIITTTSSTTYALQRGIGKSFPSKINVEIRSKYKLIAVLKCYETMLSVKPDNLSELTEKFITYPTYVTFIFKLLM